ncbi:MAG: hypothetical protein L6R41_002499 [Letrouitia leprolyta]|nr:MAG: hypothetical protein L6R41_002499 [Letrouitia leprolyta]
MATAELFENEESRLFEQSSEGSFVDILVHTRLATKSHDPVWESFASSANTRGYVKTDSDIRNDFYSSRIKDPEQMAQVAAKSIQSLIGPPQMRFRRLTEEISCARKGFSGFECAYALKFAELNNRSTQAPWSVRQTAIYYRYEIAKKFPTLVIISASTKIEVSLKNYLKRVKDISASNPFEIHIIFLDAVIGNWRFYIIYLTERIIKESDKVLVGTIKDQDPRFPRLDFEQRQLLNDFEDKILDVLLAIDSTLHTIGILTEKHQQLCDDPSCFKLDTGHDRYDCIVDALHEKRRELMFTRTKVETLHSKLKKTVKTVRF